MDKLENIEHSGPPTGISRRNMVKYAAIFGVGIAASGALVSCASGSSATVAGSTGTATAKTGGMLKIAILSDPPNLDPISNTTSRVLNIIGPCYNSLVMFDPLTPEKVVGDLADTWTVSPDGKTLTFKLVQNAKFHDGKPVTSADVKYTFDYIRNPPAGVTSPRQAVFRNVDSIETPDEFTVSFNLKAPSPSMLTNLADGWLLVLPKHVLEAGEDLKTKVVGSGPFKLKSAQRGVSFELERNPEYHVAGRPFLDGVTLFVVPATSTQFAYLSTGRIHYYENMAQTDVQRAKETLTDKVTTLTTQALGYDGVFFNATKAPWNDIRVRQAANLAFDRAEAITVAGAGQGLVGGAMLPSGVWTLPADELEKLPGYGKDHAANLAQAKSLLAAAGLPNGFSAKLLVRQQSSDGSLPVYVKDQLAKIGINVTLDPKDDATAFGSLQKHTFEIAAWANGLTMDDPDYVFGSYYLPDGATNYSGLVNEDLAKLYAKQSQTLDQAERLKLVQQMERLAHADVSQSYLYWRTRFAGLSKDVQGYILHHSPNSNRRMEDVWINV